MFNRRSTMLHAIQNYCSKMLTLHKIEDILLVETFLVANFDWRSQGQCIMFIHVADPYSMAQR